MSLRSLLTVFITMALAAGAAALPVAAQAAPKRYYVSLGDSNAAGYQPNGDRTRGFADQLVPKAKKRGYRLRLVNFACGGATTTSILEQKGCAPERRAVDGPSYAGRTQAQAAARFLRRHRGQVALVTISIGGNDVTGCARGVPDPIGCVARVVSGINANVTELAAIVRKAAGAQVRIIGVTYPDVILGEWVREPPNKGIAKLSVVAFKEYINPALRAAYNSVDGKFVDVTRATGAYGPLDRLTEFPPYGMIPVPVAEVCRLTWYCEARNIHARTSGYRVTADLIARRLPRQPRSSDN